jgi:hypothetical protein
MFEDIQAQCIDEVENLLSTDIINLISDDGVSNK